MQFQGMRLTPASAELGPATESPMRVLVKILAIELPSLKRVLLLQLFHGLAPCRLEPLGLSQQTLRSFRRFALDP